MVLTWPLAQPPRTAALASLYKYVE